MFLADRVSLQVDCIEVAWLGGLGFRCHLAVHSFSILGGASLYMPLHPNWFQSTLPNEPRNTLRTTSPRAPGDGRESAAP